MKELLQQALDLLSEVSTLSANSRYDNLPDGLLTRIDELRALAQQEPTYLNANYHGELIPALYKAAKLLPPCRLLGLVTNVIQELQAQQEQPTIKESSTVGQYISSDEFLAVRLGRVAKLVGVPMPDMTHQQIVEASGTILGQIALKLEQPAQESVAALIEVRRTGGPWQRYSIYDSVALAENTKSRCEGGGIEVRVVPLYTHPAPTQPALSNDEVRAVAEQVAEEMWPGSGYVAWTQEDADFYGKFARAIEAHCRGGAK